MPPPARRPLIAARTAVLLVLLGLVSFGGSFDCRGSINDDDDDPDVIIVSPAERDEWAPVDATR